VGLIVFELTNIPNAISVIEYGTYKPVKLPKSDLISSTKIDVKYPNYEQVIPKEKDITKVFDFIDIEKLLTYCKVAKNYSGNQEIVFKINNEQMQFFPDYIIDVITSWIKLTGLSVAFISFQTNKKALVFSFNRTY
jgi:DNA polymerase III sliding clamp (beta) subunit (PCNA family)